MHLHVRPARPAAPPLASCPSQAPVQAGPRAAARKPRAALTPDRARRHAPRGAVQDLQARNAAKLALLEGVDQMGPPDVDQLDDLLQRFLDASKAGDAQRVVGQAAHVAAAARRAFETQSSVQSLVAESRWVETQQEAP